MAISGDPALLRALTGRRLDRPPVWFMRLAGRMEPEYRALRTAPSDFFSFCLAPVVGFPRGAGSLRDRYGEEVPAQGVGLGTQTSAGQGIRLQALRTIQGALDLLAAWGRGPQIFNLGRGIARETPIDHVQSVVDHLGKARISG